MRRIAHLRLVLAGSTRGCICWVERRIKMCRTHHIWIVNNPLYYPSTAVCSAPCQLNESVTGWDCFPSGKINHPLLKAWQILERVLVEFRWCTHTHVNPGSITLLYRRSLSQSKRRVEMYIWKSWGDGYRSNCIQEKKQKMSPEREKKQRVQQFRWCHAYFHAEEESALHQNPDRRSHLHKVLSIHVTGLKCLIQVATLEGFPLYHTWW